MFDKISTKITLWLLVLMSSTSLYLYYSIFIEIKEHSTKLSQKHIAMLETSIFQNLREKMNSMNSHDIQSVIKNANKLEGIENITIYKNKNIFKVNNNTPYDNLINQTFLSKIKHIQEYSKDNTRFLRITSPIKASKECISCHSTAKIDDTLGVFDFHYNIETTNKEIENFVFKTSISSLILALITIFIIYWIVKKFLHPIEDLKKGFQKLLYSKEKGSKLSITSNNEISEVSQLFNAYIDKLEKDRKHDADNFAANIINSQKNIIISNDNKNNITKVNTAFLEFFNVKDINDFISKYGSSIGETFKNVTHSNFINKEINGFEWDTYIVKNPNDIHNVIIHQNHKDYIFNVQVKEFNYNGKNYRTSVFSDITEIEETKQKFIDLLNNANQGFLYFDMNMIIGSEFSQKAQKIFQIHLENQNITHLLYPNNLEESDYLSATLKQVPTLDKERREMIFSLLDSEFIVHGKTIKIEYKLLNNSAFMLLLSDITEKKKLNNRLQKEKQILKMVVETVTTIEQFEEIRIAFEEFCQEIEKYKSLENLFTLRREIHTFKGLFSQKEMLHIVQNLHDFETIIDQSIKEEDLDPVIIYTTGDIIYSWLEQDIAILKNILGEEFFHKTEYLTIKQERIQAIYDKLLEICNKNTENQILHDVKKLLFKDITVYLKPYKHIVENLAEKLNKPIHPLIINTENIFVPPKYKNFLNSLVHVFRNSLDHGIESSEQRALLKKPALATISCTIKVENSNLIIIVSDDGSGIDIEKIKASVIDKGIVDEKYLNLMNEVDICMLIFKDGFSTTNEITNISGRGVGLASVKYEIEKLNGNIVIHNKKGKSISFVFTLPFNNFID